MNEDLDFIKQNRHLLTKPESDLLELFGLQINESGGDNLEKEKKEKKIENNTQP